MQVDSRDYVFPRASSSSSLEALQEGRSEELMDKEVRAVFLCLFTYLLGDYQNYVTVIRFKPPSFYFNKVSMQVSILCSAGQLSRKVREWHLSLSLYKLTAFVNCSVTELSS